MSSTGSAGGTGNAHHNRRIQVKLAFRDTLAAILAQPEFAGRDAPERRAQPVGLGAAPGPRFGRNFLADGGSVQDAVRRYVAAVKDGSFPDESAHTY